MEGKSRKFQGVAIAWTICGILINGYRGATPALARGRTSTLSDTQPSITIWLYDYARVPRGILNETEKELARIFTRAGVTVDWVNCPVSQAEVRAHPVCQDRMSAADVALTIYPGFKPFAQKRGDGFLGFAQVIAGGPFAHYANVYFDQLRSPDFRGSVSVGEMLAAVAAHELGHVLLNSNGHSDFGLMRAQWDRDDLESAAQGQLTFSPHQSELLREQALLRMEK